MLTFVFFVLFLSISLSLFAFVFIFVIDTNSGMLASLVNIVNDAMSARDKLC